MTLFQAIKRFLITLTWSTRPEWISPTLRKTWYRRGRHLRRVWAHRSFGKPGRAKTYIGLGTIDLTYVHDRRDLFGNKILGDGEICRTWLAEALGLEPFDAVRPGAAAGRNYRLDLAVVEARPGSFVFREVATGLAMHYWQCLALLGFGHAWVQIEGVLSDPDGTMLKFVERRRLSGLLRWRQWFTGESSDALVRELIEGIAADILQELYWQLTKSRGGA